MSMRWIRMARGCSSPVGGSPLVTTVLGGPPRGGGGAIRREVPPQDSASARTGRRARVIPPESTLPGPRLVPAHRLELGLVGLGVVGPPLVVGAVRQLGGGVGDDVGVAVEDA